MKQADAVRALEDEGFKLGEVSQVMTDTVPLGMIAAQSPAADERVRGDATIDLAVSFSDGKRVMVPTVGDLEQVTAEQVATSLGLEPLVVDEYSDETVEGAGCGAVALARRRSRRRLHAAHRHIQGSGPRKGQRA